MKSLLLFAWFLVGLLTWPSVVRGQRADPNLPRRSISGTVPFEAGNRVEISSRTGSSVSVRELSIPQRARNAYNKGIDRLAKRDPAGSLAHLQRAASEFPNFYEAYYAMGLAQLNLGRNAEAQQAYQQSIEMSGGHYAAPHFGLSALLCAQQRFAEAEPVIRKALELDPGFGPGHFTLAWALFGLNRLDQAEKNAHETVIREPNLAPAHLLLANIYIHRHDYAALLGELEAYLKLEPDGAMSAQVRRVHEAVKRSLTRSEDILVAAPKKP